MQKLVSFFFFLFATQAALFPYSVQGQSPTEQLAKADSLYEQNLFLEAATLYQQLLNHQTVYSPAMLLKLAFIKEASGDYTSALYYLNLYYSKYPNRKTLKKMEALAQQHNLQGFEYSDYDFFATQGRKYYKRMLELLLMAAVITGTVSLLLKLRGRRIGTRTLAGYLVLLGFILYYLNFLSFGRVGIVNYDQLALMSGPAASSTLVRLLPKGNRLEILGEADVWLKVQVSDSVAYVRKDHVLRLPE